jgi:PAS domain S-box-containing protein
MNATALRRYGFAVVVAIVTTAIWVTATFLIGNRVSSSFFLVAVIVVSRYAGYGPAWLALALGAIPVTTSQYLRLGLSDPGFLAIIVFYFILGTIMNMVMESERAARQKADRNAAEALEKQDLLENEITERHLIDLELRMRESQLRGIMDNATAVIYLKDADGRYLLINRRYRELFPRAGEDLIGKTDLEWFPEPIARTFQAADAKVWETQTAHDFEEIALHDDGPHMYRSVKFPIFNEKGKMVALGGISTDISDLQSAHDALKAEQSLLHNLIQVQENEKQLICYDIHDGMVQSVAGALMLLDAYAAAHRPTNGANALSDVIQSLRQALNEGRRVIRGVRSPVLDDSGVVAAIQELIDQASGLEPKVEFIHPEQIGRLPKPIETAIYRVVQEALTNARKHSSSQRAQVELRLDDGRVHVEVRDFGRGFDLKLSRRDTLGLLGMTERVRLLGGKCTIESKVGSGTCVAAWLPVEAG